MECKLVRRVGPCVLATITVIAGGRAAAQDLPPAPVPVVTGPPVGLPPPPPNYGYAPAPPPPAYAPVQQPALVGPPPPPAGPPACAPYEDRNGPLLVGDPLLDRPCAAPPGWFAAVEANIVVPHIKNRLVGEVPIDGIVDTVHLPTAPLDGTGAPRVELGYRFAQGFGEFLVSYRSLVSEGHAALGNFDIDGGDGFLKSRLNANVIDLDYGSREFSLAPRWDMQWRVGARVAFVYFDSHAYGNFLEQRTSNDFRGAGPHVVLDLARRFDRSPWAIYTRLEGAAMLGEIRQSFDESVLFPDGTLIGGASQVEKTQAVPTVNWQIGLRWSPPTDRGLAVTFGYELENWWYLGQAGASRAELLDQGGFLRAEFNF